MKKQLDQLTILAAAAGAEGIWLIRGADNAAVKFNWPHAAEPLYLPVEGAKINTKFGFTLDIADAELLVIMRFPAGDGGDPGVEAR